MFSRYSCDATSGIKTSPDNDRTYIIAMKRIITVLILCSLFINPSSAQLDDFPYNEKRNKISYEEMHDNIDFPVDILTAKIITWYESYFDGNMHKINEMNQAENRIFLSVSSAVYLGYDSDNC